MGVQIVPPGERARPHRHTIAAVRFIIEGNSKAWTVVEGEPMAAEPGDFILTPNWTWHEHVNDGAEPVIWIDALDAPLLRHLQLNFGENYPSQRAPLEAPKELSRHAASLARPVWLEEERSFPGATYRYTWSQILETLDALRNSSGEPCDGVVLRYANPWTGGPTLPTFSCAVQLLAPGLKTRAHRHTSVSFYHVVRGCGATQVGPRRLDWKARDFFMIPNWVWHAHENMGAEDAILFSLSDWPLLQPIGLYREEIEGEQGSRERSDLFGGKSFRPPT
jgi:gentisate 1,2-dioxygenase